jgi:hypothetical protein
MVALDFDAVLAEYHGYGDGTPGEPLIGAIELVRCLADLGQEVAIFTSRDLGQVQAWLTRHEVIEHVGIVTNHKDLRFHVMLDDRALNFTPDLLDFPMALAKRLAWFKPYWKKRGVSD